MLEMIEFRFELDVEQFNSWFIQTHFSNLNWLFFLLWFFNQSKIVMLEMIELRFELDLATI